VAAALGSSIEFQLLSPLTSLGRLQRHLPVDLLPFLVDGVRIPLLSSVVAREAVTGQLYPGTALNRAALTVRAAGLRPGMGGSRARGSPAGMHQKRCSKCAGVLPGNSWQNGQQAARQGARQGWATD
jgi:hypothetical protein